MKSRIMKWTGNVSGMGEGSGVYRVFVGKPEVKRPMGRPRCRWEDNIRANFQEVGFGSVDWIELVQAKYRCKTLVNAVMNIRIP
jgi:hypothetical protein